jgi:hypothetical protein
VVCQSALVSRATKMRAASQPCEVLSRPSYDRFNPVLLLQQRGWISPLSLKLKFNKVLFANLMSASRTRTRVSLDACRATVDFMGNCGHICISCGCLALWISSTVEISWRCNGWWSNGGVYACVGYENASYDVPWWCYKWLRFAPLTPG